MTQLCSTNEVHQVIEWIISTRPDLLEKARLIIEGKYNPQEDTEENKTILNHLKNLLIVNPDDLHGRVYVTEGVETHSKITAGSITFANWINCVSNFSLFLFMVQNIHPVIGFTSAPASTGINNSSSKHQIEYNLEKIILELYLQEVAQKLAKPSKKSLKPIFFPKINEFLKDINQ